MRDSSVKCYSLTVRNRPGELAKVTKLLSEAGLQVSDLRVASCGDRAAIRFAVSATGPRPSGARIFSRSRA